MAKFRRSENLGLLDLECETEEIENENREICDDIRRAIVNLGGVTSVQKMIREQ